MKSHRFLSVSAGIVACCIFFCTAAARAADEQRVEVLRNGVQTTLVLPEYKSQGVPYASFSDIARQLGGSVDVADSRVVFRLDGQQIAIGLEDDQLQSDGTTVSLGHPVRGYNGDALIAISDLVPVLREGFGFGTPATPPAGSALSLDSVEPALESVEPLPESAMEDVELESIERAAGAPLESAGAAVEEPAVRPLEDPVFSAAGEFLLAIDPGHGGEDGGAVGANGVSEKEICLAVAESLRRVLKEKYGIATVTTREGDVSLNLASRQSALSGGQADLVISIHAGANYATAAQGPMVFAHRPPQSLSIDPKPGLKAAQTIASALDSAGTQNPVPVHEVSLALLRDVNAPGVLVELGNLANAEDEARLAGEGYQTALATALADGVNRLLGGGSNAEGNP